MTITPSSPSPRHLVLKIDSLNWPAPVLPTKRFRLLLVGDRLGDDRESMLHFAEQALASGMVYFCAWGDGCELVHDLVDVVIIREPEIDVDHVLLTTWHAKETLEEVAWYFAWATQPADAYLQDSEFWLAICVGENEKAERLDSYLTANLTPQNHDLADDYFR